MLVGAYVAVPSGHPGGEPAPAEAKAQAQAEVKAEACPGGTVPERDARSAARKCRAEVGIADLTTEQDQAWALPDGSVRYEHRYRPVRVKRDGKWTPVDTTLAFAADGSVRPAATSTGLVFSGGGAAPMVAVTEGGGTLRLGSPAGVLPKPQLKGDTATYAEVLPGVDLTLTADVQGYSQVLVVKSREAAANPKLDRLAFAVDADNLKLSADASGNLRAADARGKVLLSGNAPIMWDAAAERVKAMRTTLAQASLVVTPDRAMLDAAATKYPVYIDPGVTAMKSNWVKVDSGNPTVNYMNVTGNAPVGSNNGGANKYRSFFDLDVGSTPIAGKYIASADFVVTETFTASCEPRQIDVWATGYAGAANTWNNQPAFQSILSSQNVAGGASGCPAKVLRFPVTPIVRSAAAGAWSNVSLALRSPTETDNLAYRTFNNNPNIVIIYRDYAPVAGCPGGVAADSDFNGDGTTDVAVGAPLATVNGLAEAGQVTVRYSGSTPVQTLYQGASGVPGTAEVNDQFGFSLAGFDSNVDGCADLVVGAPYEDGSAADEVNSGWFAILFGGPNGLGQGVWFDQQNADVGEDPESSDWFGFSVTAGNTAAGEPFMAVGAPGEDNAGDADAGMVHYRIGSTSGTVAGASVDERLGYSLASTPNHFAIGQPGRTDAGHPWAGGVRVFAFSGTTIKQVGNTIGGAPANTTLGKSIAMVPVSGTSDSLLAVGSPGADWSNVPDSGVVSTYRVAATAYSAVAVGVHHPQPRAGDRFGEQVIFSPGTDQTLVVGAPGYDLANARDGGWVVGVKAAGAGSTVAIKGGGSEMSLEGAFLGSSATSLYVNRPVKGEVSAYSWSSIAAGAPAATATWTGPASFGTAVR
ncbi:DNRLRE domain-containing protein [Actinoplanes sp. NPDC049596]|uniref:DNRLRE domain-containing protein n=1 Tax=unclassified Actinoplanes TaxID=2626549 RepID=UPI00342F1EA4